VALIIGVSLAAASKTSLPEEVGTSAEFGATIPV